MGWTEISRVDPTQHAAVDLLQRLARSTDHWQGYWAAGHASTAAPDWPLAAPEHSVSRLWQALLEQYLCVDAACLDLACGNGEIARRIADLARQRGLHCRVQAVDGCGPPDPLPTHPGVMFQFATDAAALPFAAASFDLVVSQHGIEYCPEAAWAEMTRVLRPGGRSVLLLHAEDGVLTRTARIELEHLDFLQQIDIFAHARRMAEAGEAFLKNQGERERTGLQTAQQGFNAQTAAISARIASSTSKDLLRFLLGMLAPIFQLHRQFGLPWVLHSLELVKNHLQHQRLRLEQLQLAATRASALDLADGLSRLGMELELQRTILTPDSMVFGKLVVARKSG